MMFQMRVVASDGRVCVGIAAKDAPLDVMPGTSAKSIAFLASGEFVQGGKSQRLAPEAFSSKDVVGLLLDFESDPDGRVSLFRNGREVASAPRSFRHYFGDADVVPVVGLKGEGSGVRCIGLRQGGIRITFAQGRADRQASLAARFVDGIPHGMGRLQLASAATPPVATAFATMLRDGDSPAPAAAEAPAASTAAGSGAVASAAAGSGAPSAAPTDSATAADAPGVPKDVSALVGLWVRGQRCGVFLEERTGGPSTYALYRGRVRVRDATEAEFERAKEVFRRSEAARVARLKELAQEAAMDLLSSGAELTRMASDGVEPQRALAVGDVVCVKPDVSPSSGWGQATAASVGVITAADGDRCTVDFPEHPHWNGRLSEMELASAGGGGSGAVEEPSSAQAAVASLVRLPSSPDAQRSRERRFTVTGSISVDRSQLFTLMPSLCSSGLKPDAKLTEVSASRGDAAIVLGSRGFTRGVHYWEVHLDERHENLVFEGHNPMVYVGVAERWGRLSGGSWRDYGLVNYMAVNSTSESERLYGEHFLPTDRIGVLLDMDRGVISFMRDSRPFGEYKFQDWGPAFTKVRSGANGGPSSRVLFPCIGMRSGCQPVRIDRHKWVSLSGAPPRANLSAILEAATLMQRWDRPAGQTVHLPPAVEAEAHARFVAMEARPNVVVARARGGIRIPFDRSTAVCTAVLQQQGSGLAGTLRGGDRIKFWGKETEIMGAYRGRLWYRVDGEDAWYFQGTEFDEQMSENPSHNCPLPRSPAVQAEEDAELKAAGSSGSEPVPRATFHEWISDPFWALGADEALVRLVNMQCDQQGVDPPNLTLGLCPATQRAALGCPEAFTQESFLRQLRARFAVLLCLNWRLEPLLPLVDLTLRRRSGVLATADPTRLTFPSALGRRVAMLRGLCFNRAKKALLASVLQVTAKHTDLGGDNFAKPSDVPEITLDRLGAEPSNLRAIQSLKRRQARSVMGQLRNATSGWGDAAFRRDFAWRDDQGQQRNFFVTMKGERANDNGGPYRAIIEAGAASEPAGPLELFVPCPNAQEPETGGGNQEVFVLNPTPSARPRVVPLSMAKPPASDQAEQPTAAGASAAGAAAASDAAGEGASQDRASIDPQLLRDIDSPPDPAETDPVAALRLDEFRLAGTLAASAVRHDILLPMDLPPSLWRALSGEPVTASDLFAVDRKLANAVREVMGLLPAGVTSADVKARLARRAAAGGGAPASAVSAASAAPGAEAADKGEGEESEGDAAGSAAANVSPIGAVLPDEDIVELASSAGAADAAVARALDSLRSAAEFTVSTVLRRNPEAPRGALRRAAAAVTFANRSAFVAMALDAAARAGSQQLRAWANGVAGVLPSELFPLFTRDELQQLFCGSRDVDVALLRRVAEFPSGLTHDDNEVRWLFEVLEEADQETRRQFVSFVAARNRMPQSADGFTQSFKINRRSVGDGESADKMLPSAATCFFELKLPPYSTKEALRERLLEALAYGFEMDDN